MKTTVLRYIMVSAVGLMAGTTTAYAVALKSHFTVDIAGDCNRFITEGKGHLDPELNPQFGDNFMQEGIIYKGGTFERYCPETLDCGLHEDGTPEFPDEVVGKWTCFGAFIGDGIATTEGAWIASDQFYNFHVEELSPNVYTPGRHGLTSQGVERVDEVLFYRAVTGGFGKYKSATGQIEQVKVGFNQTTCENFVFTFKLDFPIAKER